MAVSQEQWADFGKLVFEKLSIEVGESGWTEVSSDVLMAIAADCGIAQRVEYDPDEHGPDGHVDALPGDEIWLWADATEATAATRPR